jgi:hypothetical protein
MSRLLQREIKEGVLTFVCFHAFFVMQHRSGAKSRVPMQVCL